MAPGALLSQNDTNASQTYAMDAAQVRNATYAANQTFAMDAMTSLNGTFSANNTYAMDAMPST